MLISTKMHPPQLKPNLLERQHVIDHLATGSQSQLIVISGPAGYGKTSLVLQWIHQHGPQIAWYSVDESDNDPDLFFRYLMTALVNGGGGLKKALSHLLHDGNPFSPDDVIPPIIHALSTLTYEWFMVIDDYHLVTNDAIHLGLARLVRYLPPGIHVVIISRHMLPRTLHPIKYQCDFSEITVQDLKFSEDETAHFFKKVIPLELTYRQIRVLNRITRGWVTGLQIYGLWQKSRKLMERPKGMLKITGRESVDYLMNEVVKSQPEAIKSFLYQTAGLNRFNADMCRYITGNSDAQKMLTDMHRHHLFIIPLDPEHTWYRYHHLFAEALREWVKMASPGMLEQTRKKAAMWCAEHQHPEEAFQYAWASGDFEFLADLLEAHLSQFIMKFEIVSSLRWLSKLPRDVFLNRPLLRLIECDVNIYKMQIEDIDRILSKIEDQINEGVGTCNELKESTVRDYLTYLKMTLDCYGNMFDMDIEHAKKIIEEISQRNKPMAGHMSLMIVARSYLYRGDLHAAEKEIKKVSPDIFSTDHIADQIVCMTILADIERTQGRLNQAEKILLDGFDYLKQQKMSDTPVKNLLYGAMVLIHLQRNEVDKALECATQSLKYVERTGVVDSILMVYYILSTIWIAKGDLKKALHYAQKSKTLSDSLDYVIITDLSDIAFSLIALHQGDLDAMKQKANIAKPDLSKHFTVRHRMEAILYVLTCIYKGKLTEAVDVLEDFRKRCKEKQFLENVLNADVMLSGIHFLMGQKNKAKKLMERVISLSEKQGYIHPFAAQSVLILPLLEELRFDPKPVYRSDHFQKILQVCTPRNADAPVEKNTLPKKSAYDLTERELEILRFISNGYQNKQIADMAFISLSTVKTHIQHILKKLDVTSRTQAAVKAKEFLYPQ